MELLSVRLISGKSSHDSAGHWRTGRVDLWCHAAKTPAQGELQVMNLGEQYREMQNEMRDTCMSDAERKLVAKRKKKRTKLPLKKRNCVPNAAMRKW